MICNKFHAVGSAQANKHCPDDIDRGCKSNSTSEKKANFLQAQISIHNFLQCLSVCNSRSLLPANQPWQMRFQKKAHNPGKVEIIFLWPYDQ